MAPRRSAAGKRPRARPHLANLILLRDVDRIRRVVSAAPFAAIEESNHWALRLAAGMGMADVVSRLLERGADVHACNDHAIRWACEEGHTEVVKRLAAAGGDVHVEDDMCLCEAARIGNLGIVDLLLGLGANPNVGRGMPLRLAARGGFTQVVDSLLAAGADPSIGRIDGDGTYRVDALSEAAHEGRVSMLRRLVKLKHFCNLNELLVEISGRGRTTHHVAECLMEAGANPAYLDSLPLRRAAEVGNVQLVELYLSKSTTVNKEHALIVACLHHRRPIIRRLIEAGVDVNAHGGSAIENVGHQQLDILQELLVAGACPRLNRLDHCRTWPIPDSSDDLYYWKLWTFRVVMCVHRRHFYWLSFVSQALWLRYRVFYRLRLCRYLQRARNRLDRPPTAALGTCKPTRDELVANLRTAGKRFAREYWAEGLPLFFPGRVEELGPVPEEFKEVCIGP